MARKGKYYEQIEPKLDLIEAMCRDGATDEMIANKFEIALSTFYEYKKKHKEFAQALSRGKEIVDIQVENALLKRALGFEYEEVTYEYGKETKKVKKYVIPDTTAQIYWLKNRKPEQWRDKQDRDNEDALKKLDKLLEEQKNA